MCPTVEEEVKELSEEAEKDSIDEVPVEGTVPDEDLEEEATEEEAVFEGVDKVEDIKKGKESEYGI